jgi:NRPS condensation-like uncharacterized protein
MQKNNYKNGAILMTYTRPLSTIERYYVSCDSYKNGKFHTPCVNQMVVEGHGDIDSDKLRKSVIKASYANPGSRVKLKGHLGFSRWVDSDLSTPLRIVHENWDGRSNDDSEFLLKPLPPRSGPTSEVVLVIAETKHFIIIRTHHGVMDGRGTLHFANDIFRCLRGEKAIGENSHINDMQLAQSLNDHAKADSLGRDVAAATGAAKPVSTLAVEIPSRWIRKTLLGKHKGLLSKVALEIARYARLNGEEIVRFQIPVDMRPHQEGLNSTANLTGGIVVNVNLNTSSEDWNADIQQQLAGKKEAEIPRFFKFLPFHFLNWVPTAVIRSSNNKLIKKRRTNSQFRTTGVISNLGLLKVKEFSGAEFIADKSYFIPPEFETTALFVTLAGHPEGVEIIMRSPEQLDGGRIEKMMDFVIHNIEQTVSNQIALAATKEGSKTKAMAEC